MKKRILALVLTAVLAGIPTTEILASEMTQTQPYESVQNTEEEEETDQERTVQTITGFAPFDIKEHYISLPCTDVPEEEQLKEQMPETLDVYLNNEEEPVPVEVDWYCLEDNFGEDEFYYQFSPVFDENLYMVDESIEVFKDAPYIGVFLISGENAGITTFSVADESCKDYIFHNYVDDRGYSVAAVCGILANMEAESAFKSNNLQNTYESKLEMTDEEYTKAVDSGEYTEFASDSAGYGLCQWTSSGRKQGLLDMSQETERSIGDMTLQADYLEYELLNGYKGTYDYLHDEESVPNTDEGAYNAGYYFCSKFERPANTEQSAIKRGNLAKNTYWEEYKDYQSPSAADFTGMKVNPETGRVQYMVNGEFDTETNGWLEWNGNRYYLESGVAVTGWLLEDETWYYFNEDGTMATGWVCTGGKWYYLDQSGAMQTGWLHLGDNWFYLRKDGDMHTGWLELDNAWYFFNESGVRVSGWLFYGSEWYFMKSDGKMAVYWVRTGGEWYYLDQFGVMQTGWLHRGNYWYYLKKSGAMHTGWLEYGNAKYYMDSEGRMLTGTHVIKGVRYTFSSDGALVE